TSSSFIPSLPLFHHFGAHRDPHSFPTRRSSDLLPRMTRPRMTRSRMTRSRMTRSRMTTKVLVTGGGRDCAIWPCAMSCRDGPRRSEEHTSELQSRENLVCRLLLEKKKEQSQ